ncbi:MAG: hypothetical protein AAF633_02540 [Chloroflexota bacterium]
MPRPSAPQRLIAWILILGTLAALYWITGNKLNQSGGSDPLFTLPTAQMLWQTGTPYLDDIANQKVRGDVTPLDLMGSHVTIAENGRLVDFFPPGTAIISLPLVAVVNQLGYDLTQMNDNFAVQNRMAFLTTAVAFLLLFGLLRLYLPPLDAAVLSSVSFMGSVLLSTMGAALFSINYTVICMLIVLIFLSARERQKQLGPTANLRWHDRFISFAAGRWGAGIVGLTLFVAFFCRASSVSFIFSTFLFLFIPIFWLKGKERTEALWYASVAAGVALLLLIGYALWSYPVYGSILPPYYSPGRLQDSPTPTWIGMIGNLISPSRGIFVFMPFLILLILGIGFKPGLLRKRILLYVVGWALLHLWLTGQAVIWWGGNSYGPRLLTELMPGLLLLITMIWVDYRDSSPQPMRLAIVGIYLFLGGIGLYLNIAQGLFNPLTTGPWNEMIEPVVAPPFDRSHLFQWRFAQWRTNNEMLCTLDSEIIQLGILPYEDGSGSLMPLPFNTPISYNADQVIDARDVAISRLSEAPRPAAESGLNIALYQGFEIRSWQDVGRWSVCPQSKLHFYIDRVPVSNQFELRFKASALIPQAIDVELNGQSLGSLHIDQEDIQQPQAYSLLLDVNLLTGDQLNTITFTHPLSRPATVNQDGFNHARDITFLLQEFSIHLAPTQ